MNLRQAAQRALKAMEDGEDRADMIEFSDALIALRAALAEPEQEPVAWRTFDGEGGWDYRTYEDNQDYAAKWAKRNPLYVGWVEPLYTAPTPRKPLMDEEMRECAQAMNAEPLAEGWPELIKFARAIERAHGIGEQQ